MKPLSFFSKTVATIEVVSLTANSCVYTLCFFVWKSNQLHFLSYSNGKSVAALKTALQKIDVCIWIINDNTVINKVNATASKNLGLSNMKWSSFYAATGATVLSVLRINDFQEHLKQIESIKKKPCQVFLGLSPIESILGLLPPKFELQRHVLKQKAGQLLSIDSSTEDSVPQTLTLDGEEYPVQAVLGFAAAVAFLKEYSLASRSVFTLPKPEEKNTAMDVERSSERFRILNLSLYRAFMNQFFFKRLIRVHGILIGVLLLLGLTTQAYRKQMYEEKKSVLASVEVLKRSNQIISEKITVKRKLYTQMIKNKNRNIASLIDGLLHNMPNTISINELRFQPQKRKNSDYDKRNLAYNQFFVQGSISHKKAFSEWKNHLETLSWIQEINALQLNQVRPNFLQFEFTIELNNE